MFTRPIGQPALKRLVKEMVQQGKNFTPSILNRLKNEDPHFHHVAIFFAKKARDELGEAAFKTTLDDFASAYRLLELGQHYAPPSISGEISVTPEQQIAAEEECAALLGVLMRPPKK